MTNGLPAQSLRRYVAEPSCLLALLLVMLIAIRAAQARQATGAGVGWLLAFVSAALLTLLVRCHK